MANQDGDVRAAIFTGPYMPAIATAERWKLPILLTARPGNVGVQIDSHRSMNLFSHPRSVKFTTQFHGVMYEDGSLENYSRVVERTAQRARLLGEKLDKLRTREQYLLEDEAKRKQRRVQREAARQRRLWQMQQAAKRADERAQEAAAAIVVQRVVRGALARRATRVLRQIRSSHQAASMLQHAMKTYVCRQNLARERERRAREEEERRELEMHSAASVLQRQARKRLHVLQDTRAQTPLTSMAEDNEDEEEEKEEQVAKPASPKTKMSTDEHLIADALSRGISLELLFSDDEDTESARHTNETSSVSPLPAENVFQAILPQPPPKVSAARRPRRPMSVKRVGGGYRTRLLPYPAPPDEAAASEAARASRPRKLPQAAPNPPTSTGASDEFLRGPRRSPTFPKSVISPTRLAIASASSKADDSHDVRPASPVATRFTSPYAVPQRLHHS